MGRRVLPAVPFLVAFVAATAASGYATASPRATRVSVTVSLTPDPRHPGHWCASVVDPREPDGRLTLCQSPREQGRTESILGVDCPTRRVVLLGLAARHLQAVSVIRGHTSDAATLARRKHVTAFALGATLSDFPARLRTRAGSRVRTRSLRDPNSLCRGHPRVTGVIDAFGGAR